MSIDDAAYVRGVAMSYDDMKKSEEGRREREIAELKKQLEQERMQNKMMQYAQDEIRQGYKSLAGVCRADGDIVLLLAGEVFRFHDEQMLRELVKQIQVVLGSE